MNALRLLAVTIVVLCGTALVITDAVVEDLTELDDIGVFFLFLGLVLLLLELYVPVLAGLFRRKKEGSS